MTIKEQIELTYLYDEKYPNRNELLDMITPIYLNILGDLSDIEKHLLYALIIRPRKVIKDDLTKKDLSVFLTTKDLLKELKESSSVLSVYLNKLVDKDLVEKKLINKKNYAYIVKEPLFCEWFLFRNKINSK